MGRFGIERINGQVAFLTKDGVPFGAVDFRASGEPGASQECLSYVETGTAEYLTDDPGVVGGLAANDYNVLEGDTDQELTEPWDGDLPVAVVYSVGKR